MAANSKHISKGIQTTNTKNKVLDILNRAMQPNSVWDDKDEFLDFVYWFRQVFGLILGIIWGIIPLKGFFSILIFVFLNTVSLYIYFNKFQVLDEDDFGGFWEVNKEGFITSFAGFLMMWIIFYTGVHC